MISGSVQRKGLYSNAFRFLNVIQMQRNPACIPNRIIVFTLLTTVAYINNIKGQTNLSKKIKLKLK